VHNSVVERGFETTSFEIKLHRSGPVAGEKANIPTHPLGSRPPAVTNDTAKRRSRDAQSSSRPTGELKQIGTTVGTASGERPAVFDVRESGFVYMKMAPASRRQFFSQSVPPTNRSGATVGGWTSKPSTPVRFARSPH